MVRVRIPSGWTAGAVVLASAILALSVYRAATQSITHDEARTYVKCVSGPLSTGF